jgi:hypothetical protein
MGGMGETGCDEIGEGGNGKGNAGLITRCCWGSGWPLG